MEAKFAYEPWTVTENGFSPENLREAESAFALANGLIGMRGNLEEVTAGGADTIQGTFINGVFDQEPIIYGEAAYGYAKNHETICNVMDAKGLVLTVNGESLDLGRSKVEGHTRILDLRRGTRFHGQHRADRNGIAQAGGAFHGCDADALVALTAVDLRGFAGAIEQGLQNRRRRGEQTVLACRGRKLRESRAEHEAAMLVAQYEAMPFQRDRKTVRRRTCEPGRGNQLSERGRTGFKGVEDFDCLVEHADPGMDFIALRGCRICAIRLVRSVLGLRRGHSFARVRRSHTSNYAISHIEMQNVCGSRVG